MSYGLIVKNPLGDLVVDNEFVNYAENQRGTIQHQVGTAVTATSLINLSPAITTLFPPLLSAIWPANDNVYCFGYELVGAPGNWTAVRLKMGSFSGSHSVQISYRIYSTPTAGPSFGLRVFRGINDPSFSSERPPLELGAAVPWAFTWDLFRTGRRSPIYGLIVRPNPQPGGMMLLGVLSYAYTTRVALLRGGSHSLLVNSGYGYGAGQTIRELGVFQTDYPDYDLSDSDYLGTDIPMAMA